MEIDIYEYPKGHTGNRKYVSVRGHTKSVAAIYCYKGTDGYNYIRPEFGGSWDGIKNYSDMPAPMIMRDMEPYQSVIDGSTISSRSTHREHLSANECIELGNERFTGSASTAEQYNRVETAKAIKEHIDKVKVMPEKEYQERVKAVAQAD